MNHESIYKEHYLGRTYGAGVAYLRARSSKDDRAPSQLGNLTLDRQRESIAKAAKAERMIIVAEFIQYGDDGPDIMSLPVGLCDLIDFADSTHIKSCFVANRYYVARDDAIRDFWDEQFQFFGYELYEAIE